MQKLLHASLSLYSRQSLRLPFLQRILTIFFLGIASVGFQQNLWAQATTLTTTYANNNGSGLTTFNLQNTNPYDIIITEVGSVTGSTGTQTANLFYKTTPVNGSPGAISAANGWNLAATGTYTAIANTTTSTTQPMITGASFVVPAGTTYGMAMSSTGMRYSDVLPTTTVSAGGVNFITGANIGYGGAIAPAAPGNTPRGFIGYITFVPAPPCVAPPNAGQAVSTTATVCPNTNFQLSLTGATSGMGMTYQWQASANGTSGWTNIAGATSASVTVSQLTTTFYQAILTCSGQPATSGSVQVTTTAIPISGTFTINKNAPASATNFQTFAAAIASIECPGANGPIVFNVVAGTGPYNERVVVPVIPGTSATNTVTFNGNGNKISFLSTTAERAVLTLNGADFVKFDNFQIDATDPTFGWGIHFTNGADNNIISNNTINISSTSTTEANSSGIVFSSSLTSITATGNTGNNNLINNNTINGGFKNIQLSSINTAVGNNQIRNNILKDSYADAVELNGAKGTLVEGNDISRPTRTVIGTASGITMSSGTILSVINKNRIHNTHDAELAPTGNSYGIYATASDAPVGSENIVKNNVLYNFNSTGTTYGMYNAGSDGVHYYHNTIYLDNALNNGNVRGFYQTTAATNIKFINNIIYITSGSSGNKHALYFNTATSTIQSNNNVLYVDPAAANSHIGYYNATNHSTLAAWKLANSNAYDQNSVSINPNFVSAATGNLLPGNILINGLGQPAPAVTDDILGNPRSAAAPDPGAYEFGVAATDAGITAITSPVSGCALTNQENVTITITNFGNTTLTSVPVSYQIGSNPAVNETFTGSIVAGANANYTFTTKADLSATGSYTIVATSNVTGDALAANNSFTKVVTNSRFTSLPQLNFETPVTGIASMRLVTNTRSNAAEDVAASLGTGSTKGLMLDAVTHPNWATPVTGAAAWTTNPEHLVGAYFCFNPAGGNPNDPLFLSFDLKQLFKTTNANTNFRVTVNGTQVGPTYRPPFAGTPIDWQKVYVDLTPYKTLPSIEIGFESSVAENFNNGAGTANLIDNIRIVRFDPTGIKNNVLESQLQVYPNPSAGLFMVNVPTWVKTYQLEITDLSGKLIRKQTGSAQTTQLELQNAAKGVYLLKLTTEQGMAVKRLVIE